MDKSILLNDEQIAWILFSLGYASGRDIFTDKKELYELVEKIKGQL